MSETIMNALHPVAVELHALRTALATIADANAGAEGYGAFAARLQAIARTALQAVPNG